MSSRMRALLRTLTATLALAACAPAAAEESSREAICRLIDAAAARNALPPQFLTRLIWRESSFRPRVESRAGAQGIAQFMPGTAAEHGLADPFDPEAAIPASAAYLAKLRQRFGSLDLAAAAYNAGPSRVARWRAEGGELPRETREHVRFVTGRLPSATVSAGGAEADTSCIVTLAAIRSAPPRDGTSALEATIGRWGVQLIGRTDKSEALAAYASMQRRYGKVLGDRQPTILKTRLGGRGARDIFRIRIAYDARRDADGLCRRLRAAGGSCLTVKN